MTLLPSSHSLTEQLFNLVKEAGRCDLLLDREFGAPLHEELQACSPAEPLQPINPLVSALPPDACLVVARVTLQQLELLDASAALALQESSSRQPLRTFGGWLVTGDVPAQRIAKHIEKAMIARVNGGPNFVLRLWNPLILPHLPRILTPQQLGAVFGPIERWGWIDRDGQLAWINRPDVPRGPLLWALPLRLTPEQDAALDRIEYINALLRIMSAQGHAIAADRDQELDALLVKAQGKGHVTPPDMLAYALHSLQIGPNFDMLPDVQDAVREARAKGLGLCAALAEFDDAYWAAVKSAAA